VVRYLICGQGGIMIKTIYILTAGECEDKTTIGVFDSIELASFAKEQWDREAYWDKEKPRLRNTL